MAVFFRSFKVVNQSVMNITKPYDQVGSTAHLRRNHSSKIQNKIETKSSIFDRLMELAMSVPDFRRTDKGNIRHRLEDIIMLMIFAWASKCRYHPKNSLFRIFNMERTS